ncbi:response regulator [Deferribacter thermophilus]|uniref:response regulator transcription factor n=1 Tax=Deferribacter thermophilus TaxID=53573 RepID=UPI003C18A645
MPYKLLIVEDDTETLLGLKNYFEKKGFTVDIVDNGKDAYTMIQDNNYSLVITDINMPFMDGLNFLSKIRNIDEEIPVIVITAFSNIDNLVLSFDLGAVDFIEKPFDPDDLLTKVREILNNH